MKHSRRAPSVRTSEPDIKDLGFGSRVVQQTHERLLNRDGTFNVTREGVGFLRSMSPYHSLLTTSWAKFSLLIGGAYFLFNSIFAIAYVFCGDGEFVGMSRGAPLERLAEAFFFSIQTSTTIGYGHITPVGTFANICVGAEGMLSLLGFAVAAGFMFARLSRPNAKILFSDRALIAPYGDKTALEFRIANERSNQLIQVEATVILSRVEKLGSGTKRMFHELPLERQSVVFFPLSWTIVHPIDERSPFFGVTREAFYESDPEILVLLTAIDETFSQTVHARTSFKPHEIVWGARFSDMFQSSTGGLLGVDLNRIHAYDLVAIPE